MNFVRNYWKGIAVVLILIAISAAASFLPLKELAKDFTEWVQKFGPWGPIIFIAIYGLGAVLFLPGWVFTISAGLVYGVFLGTVVALSGATLGSTLAFLVARYLVRGRSKTQQKKVSDSRPSMKPLAKMAGKLWGSCGLAH